MVRFNRHFGRLCIRQTKTPEIVRFPRLSMVGVARIELATPAMSTQCSTTELHARREWRC